MTGKILNIQSSGRLDDSLTRQLSDETIAHLNPTSVLTRDLAEGMPFVNEAWIGANFTPVADRIPEQVDTLAFSDSLVNELLDADTIVFGVPIYNFGVPAVLKAWVDMVARAGLTFRYTDNGPVGLIEGKRAIVMMASGGVPIGSDLDFASGYFRHVLGFIGITDVTIIAAEAPGGGVEEKLTAARTHIAAL